MLNTSNPFEALMRVVANQIFSLVIATLRPALTEEVYDKLLCDFYNNMGDDATFTNAQVDNVRSDITTDIGGIAGVFFEHLVYLLGAVGLTNLARQQAATSGDCSDCEECEGCDTSGWIVSPPADGGNGVIDHEASNCNTLVVTAFVGGGDGRYYAQVWSGGGSDDGCVITALEYTGSAVDFLIAWDLVGEVQGTYAHSGASPVAIVGANVCSVMTRNISPNTTTIHT
jgi:hypothetical protein